MVQVVDASVAIKWFVKETDSDLAMDVLRKILNRSARFAVPELFFFEMAHVFHRVIPQPPQTQQELLFSVSRLGIERFSMTDELLRETRSFQALGLSGYDSAYIGLAKLLKGTWLTFDERAHRKVQDLGFSRVLSE